VTTTDRHVMTLTVTIPGKASPIQEIREHVAVARYLDAGWAFVAVWTVVKGRAATVPLLAPEGWPECLEVRS
jgi:hypothetical protein